MNMREYPMLRDESIKLKEEHFTEVLS